MQKYFAFQARHLDDRPLKDWAVFRWHDEVLSILWLYNRTGDKSLLDLARRMHNLGHDWEAQFADFRYTGKTAKAERTLSNHGVNNAMAMKAAAVWWLLTGDQKDRESLDQMLHALDRYHGQPSGIFSADEHYAGLDPSQGTELCAVVEAMFSLETDISILGDPSLGDRLEKIAYNALPGTLTADAVGPPVRSAGKPGHGQCGEPPLVNERSRFEHFRSGTELRLLHRQHASRVAQVRRAPVDGDGGWRSRGGRLWPQRSVNEGGGRGARQHCGDHGLSLSGRPSTSSFHTAQSGQVSSGACEFPPGLRAPAWP